MGLKIRLDNQSRDDDSVLVLCDDVEGAFEDQTCMGSSWENADGLAYTIISDEPDLIDKLRAEGYKVDATDYDGPHYEAWYAKQG